MITPKHKKKNCVGLESNPQPLMPSATYTRYSPVTSKNNYPKSGLESWVGQYSRIFS